MNETAKITLSDDELQLVCNTRWILTKRTIIEKVYGIFGRVSERMRTLTEVVNDHELQCVYSISPKISRGENYLLLPYVMLDYPRYFEKADMLAIRSLFWWGNHFSVHLLVSGKYKDKIIRSLAESYEMLMTGDYYLCISDSPWRHHFEADNYTSIQELTKVEFVQLLNSSSFVKIGKKWPLNCWDEAEEFLIETFKTFERLVE